jgi:hypothetical protein
MTQKFMPNACSVIRPNRQPGNGTVFVLGVPRGGTSVMAGICHLLGVPMGLDIDSSNMEDREFQRVLSSSDVQSAAEDYFRRAKQRGPLIGVKNPVSIDRIHEIAPVIPNPVYVVVLRDTLATAQREAVTGCELLGSLHEAARRKYAILEFVEPLEDPLVMVSYERLLEQPRPAIELLSRFVVGQVDHMVVGRAAELVQPNSDMPYDIDFVRERLAFEKNSLHGRKLAG